LKKTYKAQNIECSNCAQLIKTSLKDQFGQIDVNLEKEPKEVSLFIVNKEREEEFFKQMKELGFKIIN
jgi:copper chaperone CopZ